MKHMKRLQHLAAQGRWSISKYGQVIAVACLRVHVNWHSARE